MESKEEKRRATMARISADRKSPRREHEGDEVWHRRCLNCKAEFTANSPYLRMCKPCRSRDIDEREYALGSY